MMMIYIIQDCLRIILTNFKFSENLNEMSRLPIHIS